MVEVIQIDREAAASIYHMLGFGPCQHIIDGVEDDIGVVQEFARHRIAATRPEPNAAAVQGLVEAAGNLLDIFDFEGLSADYPRTSGALRSALATYRAATGEDAG